MSIDLGTRVTTDVVHSSSQSKPVVAPPKTEAPTVQLVGRGWQAEPASGNPTSKIVNEEPTAITEVAKLSEAVSRMSDYVQNIRRGLEFTIDEELDRTVITVYDVESEEVIRQIPSEEFLEMVRNFNEAGSTSLINEKA